MDNALVGSRPSPEAWTIAREQVGKRANLALGTPDGIEVLVPITALGWCPAYGHSRWCVQADTGQQETVSAERLRI